MRKDPDLFSYCIPYDDGAAPNPYWGVCTLVICKPAIRRSAKVGDWVLGTGSMHARLGNGDTQDMSGRVVYAMRVTRKLTMKEYDAFTRSELKQKIPAWGSRDPRRRVGDSIYDFSKGEPPRQRRGVHVAANVQTDLGGKHALLSDDFFYFGDAAPEIPKSLRAIAQNQQGHRRKLNRPYVHRFESWIRSLGYQSGTVLGKPSLDLFADERCRNWCAAGRAESDVADVEVNC
ncbi:MAG: hypothetical protein L6Q84_08905 [Polyangiaceae bacterium]|nr:hypothetical protein [Polyangiaceae bacterium]